MGIVLVHGGFVDGSGWEGVYKILKSKGHDVAVVQNPTISLADDVAVTKLGSLTALARYPHARWPFVRRRGRSRRPGITPK